ncbi:hypothetical protein FF011L_30750 [Roseimaritima multifibrata]|uniref:Secreted protein n=1 Tax=Roseimaritima multifibrata TaxID=1930274 RepID=A0A517MHD7_9BACT|nr:hypothetical protein [Roseimaritima multifibrata]QDS94296.1 hypothetical protein FF011L_30750 [Roseimaritima multifibrata]
MLRLAFIAFLLTVIQIPTVSTADDRGNLLLDVSTNDEPTPIRVVATAAKGELSIQSVSGIGRAVIRRKSQSWPTTVLLRLHLNGLENFRVSNGQVTIGAAVSNASPTKYRVWNEADEATSVTDKDPLWIKIKQPIERPEANLAPRDAEPLEGPGANNVKPFFQIELPPALFKNNPSSLQIEWIDFYRN